MFGFAAVTQNYLVTRNRIYESLLLVVATVMILRPSLAGNFIGISVFTNYAIGVLIYFGVIGLQKLRTKSETPSLVA